MAAEVFINYPVVPEKHDRTNTFCLMKRLFTLFTTLFLILGSLQAQTYTTLADGAIHDPNIWSLDGGVTACGCIPTTEFPTYSIWNQGSMEILHHVTAPKHSILLGTMITVNVHPGASLDGNGMLEIRAGVLNNYAEMSFRDIEVYNSGYLFSYGLLTVDPGDLVNKFQGRIDLFGQTFVPNGNIENEGWINIRAGAQVITGNQILNQSIVNIEPGACINVYGDFVNQQEVNLINGPGKAYIQSGGNLTNLGFWDTDVDWCAAGTASGLSHASNCSNCGTLPVELVDFEAEVQDGTVVLMWETASETNNSHFSVERSVDGEHFELMRTVPSDNPVSGMLYSTLDPAPFYGVSWYRLSQTDQDGTVQVLETVAVLNEHLAENRFKVFPNPFTETLKVSTHGLEGASVTIRLTDLAGQGLKTFTVDKTADFEVYSVPTERVQPGLYIVTVSGKMHSESFKVLRK
jgi:hypothetical protein